MSKSPRYSKKFTYEPGKCFCSKDVPACRAFKRSGAGSCTNCGHEPSCHAALLRPELAHALFDAKVVLSTESSYRTHTRIVRIAQALLNLAEEMLKPK